MKSLKSLKTVINEDEEDEPPTILLGCLGNA